MTHTRRVQIQILATLITAWAFALCVGIAYGQTYYITTHDEGDADRWGLIATEPVGDYVLNAASEDFAPVLRGSGGEVEIREGWGETGEPIYNLDFREAYYEGRSFIVTGRTPSRYLGSVERRGATQIALHGRDGGIIRAVYRSPDFVHYEDVGAYYGPPEDWVYKEAFRIGTEPGAKWGQIEITPVRVTYDIPGHAATVSRDLLATVPRIGDPVPNPNVHHANAIGMAMDLAGVSSYPDHITDHPNVEVLDEIMTAWAAQEDSLDLVIDDLIALADFRAGEIARLEDELADAIAATDPLTAQIEALEGEVAALQAAAEDRAARDAARVARILQALGRN